MSTVLRMSLKEVVDLLNDLKESHKQIALRLKLLELELITLKENIPGRIGNIIQNKKKFDKKVSQKYINNLLAKRTASKNSYQAGSMDEKLIQEFLEKNKGKEVEIEENSDRLEDNSNAENLENNSQNNE